MNEGVHKVLHESVVERLDRLEEGWEGLTRLEDGTLAKMKHGMEQYTEQQVGRVEAKINWLLGAIGTGIGGALLTIALKKMGYG